MDKLEKSIVHINVSVQLPIDKKTIISCIKGNLLDEKWAYHIKTFFLETSISLMHDIVLSDFFTFSELYRTHQKWDPEGYAINATTEWIKEMHYLSMGKAHELGIDRFK